MRNCDIKILRCPITGLGLTEQRVDGLDMLVTTESIEGKYIGYPIIDSIPVLLAGKAQYV